MIVFQFTSFSGKDIVDSYKTHILWPFHVKFSYATWFSPEKGIFMEFLITLS